MAPLPVQYVPNSEIVLLQYSDLLSDTADLSLSIEAAYGPDGLGILAVRGVPDLAPQRARLLKLGDEFAKLPREVKAKYEHPSSHYQFGWSHGKESFNGQPDFSKGSYYNNPLYDRPVDDEKAIAEHPSFAHPNIWPSEEDFPGLRDAFMTLGHTVVSVGKLIARHCDKFVHSRVPAYPAKRLETVIETSRCCKGRLLHYFPQVTEEPATDAAATAELPSADEMGSWCGWHNDHGSLTGLVPAMYHNAAGEEVPSPDPTGGLYIRARSGRVVRAALPKDCLGFQVGETQQVHSGGVLQATPHCVRGAQRGVGVARNTFAVFMEPMWTDGMANPEGTTREATTYGSSSRFLPKGVPELEKRWDPTDDFGRFTDRTLEAYAYEGEESM